MLDVFYHNFEKHNLYMSLQIIQRRCYLENYLKYFSTKYRLTTKFSLLISWLNVVWLLEPLPSFLGFFFKNIFYWLCYYNCPISPPFIPLHPAHPLPLTFPSFSSCPWVIHISSLASPFPILFLPSPCLFSTYHLCFLFPVPFPPFSLVPRTPPLTDNPPLHFCDSVPVLVVCLVCFCFGFLVLVLVWLLIAVSLLSF